MSNKRARGFVKHIFYGTDIYFDTTYADDPYEDNGYLKDTGYLPFPAFVAYLEKWAKDSCQGWYHISVKDTSHVLQVCFEEESDFVLFKMRFILSE